MKRFAAIFLAGIVVFSACSKPATDKKKLALLYLLLGDVTATDNSALYATLWFVDPNINGQSSTSAKMAKITLGSNSISNTTKKKLVLIHGWQPSDVDSASVPSDETLKQRLIDTWDTNFFNPTTNSSTSNITNFAAASGGYDIYCFTYLTSKGVDVSGTRFRNRLDTLFNNTNNNGKVVIVGHSMGGLVSRFALYNDTDPYIARIITLGTPYNGTPWASPQWQSSNTFLGSVASFLTGTAGGKDLAWDGQLGSISGATNAKLIALTQQTSRDTRMYKAYFGNLGNASPGGTDTTPLDTSLYTGCTTFSSAANTGSTNSDCTGPSLSAAKTWSGNAPVAFTHGHGGIHLGSGALRTAVLADLP